METRIARRVYRGHRGTPEVDILGVCTQVRFIIQDVAQGAHERWPEDRNTVEQEFVSNVAPTSTSRENDPSRRHQSKSPRASMIRAAHLDGFAGFLLSIRNKFIGRLQAFGIEMSLNQADLPIEMGQVRRCACTLELERCLLLNRPLGG